MGVVTGMNDSGFHGYSLATLYPGYSQGATQHDETVVDPEEQQAIAGVEDPAPQAVDKKKSMGILGIVVFLLALMFIFGFGR